MNIEVTEACKLVERADAADDYMLIFGPHAPDATLRPVELRDHVTSTYRRLALLLHPDRMADAGEAGIDIAGSFQKLGRLKMMAEAALVGNKWGQTDLAVFRTKRGVHRVYRKIDAGALTARFRATSKVVGETDTLESVVKVAKVVRDNDLLKAEARALEVLNAEPGHILQRHFPELLDSFACRPDKEHKQGLRQANATTWVDGITLKDLAAKFPKGIPAVHIAWIWRRLLLGLAFAHDRGVLHGALWQEHILILPRDHGVILVDWCYSVTRKDESQPWPQIKAIVGGYRPAYPTEVVAKQPPGPGTDLAIAAQTMLHVMEYQPSAMVNYFRGCTTQSLASRPDDATKLLQEFDELLEILGEPFYPRKWVDLTV